MKPATKRLAEEFSAILTSAIGAGHIAEVNARNARPEYAGCCASHDFCDANDCMESAFVRIFGRCIDPESDLDATAINTAWDLARERGFTLRGA